MKIDSLKEKLLAKEFSICLAYMARFTIQETIHLWKTQPPEPVPKIILGPEHDENILRLAEEERNSGRRLSKGFKRREFEAFKRKVARMN